MTIDDKITDEKLQFDINSAAAKISILWSGKIDKYERWRIIVTTTAKNSTWSIIFLFREFGKALEKLTKTFDEHGKKQIENL